MSAARFHPFSAGPLPALALVLALGLSTAFLPPAAHGEEAAGLIFVNDTPLEIFRIDLREEGGSMAVGTNVVPKNEFGFDPDTGRKTKSLTLDMGLARFVFEDLAPLGDKSSARVSVRLDEESGEPFLRREDGDAARADGRLAALVPDDAPIVEYSKLLGAASMAELRELPGVGTDEDGTVYLLVNIPRDGLDGAPWIAIVHPDDDRPGLIVLRTQFSEEALTGLTDFLVDTGWRPWFLQAMAGPDMDSRRMVRFPQEFPDAGDARIGLGEAFSGRNEDGPNAVLALFIPSEAYDRAASGDFGEPLPAFSVRCDNSIVLEAIYYSNAVGQVRLTAE